MDRACQRLASQVEAVASTFAAVSQPVPLPEAGEVFVCLHRDDEILIGSSREEVTSDVGCCEDYLMVLSEATEVTERCSEHLGRAASLAHKVEARYEGREPLASI